jgi:hypothetical protein
VEAKVRSCCEGVLDAEKQTALIDAAWSVVQLPDASKLMEVVNSTSRSNNPTV